MQQGYTDLSVIDYFHNAGEQLSQETALLGLVIKKIVATRSDVTNKAIIIQLIAELEQARDDTQTELIRNTLEIVVGCTPDDAGF